MIKEILLASHNAHKKEEFQKILEPYGIRVIGTDDLNDIREPIEDGDSFKANAYIKAKFYHDIYHMPVIADDSGISIDYLGGYPDIHSARFLDHLDYEEKNKLITKVMCDIKDRHAYYTCVICLIDEDVHFFEGILHGKIADVPSGDNGFGYDPIFIPDGQDMTFAMMDSDMKNAISHRSLAIKKLVDYLER